MSLSTRASARVGYRVSFIRSSRTGRPASALIKWRAAVLLLTAIFMLTAPDARAENECGPPVAEEEIVCSPSTYDPSNGNIFYGPDEANEGDFSIPALRGPLAKLRQQQTRRRFLF